MPCSIRANPNKCAMQHQSKLLDFVPCSIRATPKACAKSVPCNISAAPLLTARGQLSSTLKPWSDTLIGKMNKKKTPAETRLDASAPFAWWVGSTEGGFRSWQRAGELKQQANGAHRPSPCTAMLLCLTVLRGNLRSLHRNTATLYMLYCINLGMINFSKLCSHLTCPPICWASDAVRVRQLGLQCGVISFTAAHSWLGILAVAGVPA